VTDRSELEAVYLDSVLELSWEDGSRTRVEARPVGTTAGRFPAGVERIHVITAWNPRSRPTSARANAERSRQLRGEVERAGWRHLDAVGRSRDGTWSEDSFAVIDGDAEAVVDLARRFAQHAVYRWTAAQLAVVWTDDPTRPSVRGWSAVTPPGS
jgi:hypothetical protein